MEEKHCVNHHERGAEWVCLGCGRGYCPECVQSQVAGGVKLWKCPLCGGDCEPTGEAPVEARPESFLAQLVGAFAYPVRGKGLWMLIIGPPFFAAVMFAAWFSLFGLIGLILVAGYIAAYMVKIVRCSASGEAEPPDWPDIGGEELFRPLLLLVFASLLYGLPAIVARAADAPETVVAVLEYAGAFFLPMAVAIVAIANSFAALNPVLAVRSIIRVPLEYLTVIAVLCVVILLRHAAGAALEKMPLLGLLLGSIFGFYFLMVQMRILGVMCKANEEKLGWF